MQSEVSAATHGQAGVPIDQVQTEEVIANENEPISDDGVQTAAELHSKIKVENSDRQALQQSERQ